ncbi:NAD-dependent histone deacetylase sirtuin-1-like [Glossina fuscipes]|uniref:NAD-dependent histone deacetylase sirtuin-1-like n=1 Tax=Glossina fuscipes TaxID=7396 RepID=A0A9C6DZF1_9MUSC|nr:NAD-dependent histone deacetylase sirtuin-1-like [Glossina fuscipes]
MYSMRRFGFIYRLKRVSISEFHTVMASDKDKCDLLIVMGSSLKVRPVALIPSSIPANVPQILINREQLHHLEFDVELLGDGDVIINQICHRLGEDWQQVCFNDEILSESKELMPLDEEKETELDEFRCLAAECEDEHKSNNSIELTMRPQQPSSLQQSAAGRLFKGTYYCHGGSASYVFPGATWNTDSNETIEDDLADQKVEEEFEDSDTNQAPLSPLMTPSVEAEMVNAITSTKSHQLTANTISTPATFNNVINASNNRNSGTCLALNKQKRYSSVEEPNVELSCVTAQASNSQTSSNNDIYPPSKKRRNSKELLIVGNEFNEQINNISAQDNPNLECSLSYNKL